ncbi:MAG TPA: pilin [Patescibacteria group bacterium]|nr:pilin [Patescibacteria group bacterium]
MNWGSCLYLIPGQPATSAVATFQCLPVLYQLLINAALGLVGILAVILLIFAGMRYITAAGDSKKIEEAQKAVTYVIIGLVIVLLAFFVVGFIADITGVSCIRAFGIGSCS